MVGLEKFFVGTTNKFRNTIFDNKTALILEARYKNAGIETQLKKVNKNSMSLTTYN